MENIVSNLQNESKTTIFWYIVILITILSVSTKFTTTFNIAIITTIIIVIILVLYLNSVKQISDEDKKNIARTKHEYIRPKNKNLYKYPELEDFFFSIQEFYSYNPATYEQMIDTLDNFLTVYQEVLAVNDFAGINYPILEAQKHEIVNLLHAQIYLIPDNKKLIDKLERAITELDKLLSGYLDKVYEINADSIVKNGYNNATVVINRGPKSSNFFGDTFFTFNVL